MTMQLVLTLALCLLGFTGTIFAASDFRFASNAPFTVLGITLPAGEYVVRPLEMPSDTPVYVVYAADGRTHKATFQVLSEPAPDSTPASVTFDRANGGLEMTSIQMPGRTLRLVK